MMDAHVVNYIGYAASALIAVSFLMKNVIHIRVINLMGCILFCIYGFLLQAYPVLIANILIVVIQLYHLIRRDK